MTGVNLILNEEGRGAFVLMENGKQIGEMRIGISKDKLIAYHTEVDHAHRGKGYSGQLLGTMVQYARDHGLKVLPLCPYVLAQFKRHPETYADIWETFRR